MADYSVYVNDLTNIVRAVLAGYDGNRDRIEAGYDARFGAPAGRELIVVCDRTINDLRAKDEVMLAADLAHAAELGDDGGLLGTRDAIKARGRSLVGSARSLSESGYGKAAARQAGVAGEAPSDLGALCQATRQFLQMLDRGEARLPPPRVRGAWVTLSALRPAMEDVLTDALDIQKRLDAEKNAGQRTLVAKHRAIDDVEEALELAVAFVTGALRATGDHRLADQLKPTDRRHSSTPAREVDMDGVADPAGPADPANPAAPGGPVVPGGPVAPGGPAAPQSGGGAPGPSGDTPAPSPADDENAA